MRNFLIICIFLSITLVFGCSSNVSTNTKSSIEATDTSNISTSKSTSSIESTAKQDNINKKDENNIPVSTSVKKDKDGQSELQQSGYIIIEDQSFKINLEKWGNVKFVSAMENKNGPTKLINFLVDDYGKILYTFPKTQYKWPLFEMKAVAFRDINNDSLKDVIIIADYVTGVGNTGAIPFHICNIYFQKENKFVNIPELDYEINDIMQNENIDMVLKYVNGKIQGFDYTKRIERIASGALETYLYADYTNPKYDPSDGAAGFAVGFRSFEIFAKADERKKLVKERQIIRTVKILDVKNVEVNNDYAVIKLNCLLNTSEKGNKKEENKEFIVYLQNMGGGTWYTRNINPTVFP